MTHGSLINMYSLAADSSLDLGSSLYDVGRTYMVTTANIPSITGALTGNADTAST